MAHYLYVLQSLTLNHLENRMMAPMDFYNQASSQLNFQLLLAVQRACPATVSEILLPCPPQDQRDVLHYLRQLAFESESESSLSNERRRSLCAKEFKKLGFSVSVGAARVRSKSGSVRHSQRWFPFRTTATPGRTWCGPPLGSWPWTPCIISPNAIPTPTAG